MAPRGQVICRGHLSPRRFLAAVHNYLIAAHEILRLMGETCSNSEALPGELVLMGTEIAATRGHRITRRTPTSCMSGSAAHPTSRGCSASSPTCMWC
ncbi:MAG: hypothetical protein R3F11_03835 [Verrucomicrobiales bacterium]